jgi:hypothetical protein
MADNRGLLIDLICSRYHHGRSLIERTLCPFSLLVGILCVYLFFKNYAAAIGAGNAAIAYGKTALGIEVAEQAPPDSTEPGDKLGLCVCLAETQR